MSDESVQILKVNGNMSLLEIRVWVDNRFAKFATAKTTEFRARVLLEDGSQGEWEDE